MYGLVIRYGPQSAARRVGLNLLPERRSTGVHRLCIATEVNDKVAGGERCAELDSPWQSVDARGSMRSNGGKVSCLDPLQKDAGLPGRGSF